MLNEMSLQLSNFFPVLQTGQGGEFRVRKVLVSIAERLEHLDCGKCHEGTIKGIKSFRKHQY